MERRGKVDQGCRQSSGGIGSGFSTRSSFLVWMVFGSGNVPFTQCEVLGLQFDRIYKVPLDISEYGHYLMMMTRCDQSLFPILRQIGNAEWNKLSKVAK